MPDVKPKKRIVNPSPVDSGWARLRFGLFRTLSFALFALMAAPSALDAKPLNVKSGTSMELELTPRGLKPEVRVRLVDNVHQGVPSQAVLLHFVEVAGERNTLSYEVETDTLGYAHLIASIPAGEYLLSAEFPGTPYLTPARDHINIEAKRLTPSLELSVPTTIHRERGQTLPLRLSVQLPFPRRETLVAKVKTEGEDGVEAEITLYPAADRLTGVLEIETRFLPRGRSRIDIQLEGDDTFSSATAEAEVFTFYGPELSFHAERVDDLSERGLKIHGRATSDDGPLSEGLVFIESSRGREPWREVATLRTDSDGFYETFVPWDKLPEGEVDFRATMIPDLGPKLSTPSLQVSLSWSEATSWALRLIGAIFGLVVLSLLGYVLFERGVRAWWWWRRRRTKLPQHGVSVALKEAESLPPIEGQNAIRGIALDRDNQRPLPGTAITLRGPDEPLQLLADSRGIFSAQDLPPGRYKLECHRQGYMPAEAKLSIPHRGRYAAFRVELTSVRARVREIYLWLLEGYQPGRRLWGWLTPREVEEEVFETLGALSRRLNLHQMERLRREVEAAIDAEAPPQRLLELTTRILEEVYYSEALYDASTAKLAERLAHTLRPPLGRVGGPRRKRTKRAMPTAPRRFG